MGAFNDELKGARWLPRSVVGPKRLKGWRLVEAAVTRRSKDLIPLDGGAQVLVFHPESPSTRPSPGVLWIHGGGLVMGHGATDAPLCQSLADELGAVVVSAHYRLAPEHPFPTPAEDCYHALEYLTGLPEVDPGRVGVAGQSAGGGLAAAVAILARDRGVPLAFQALIYPMLDDRSSERSHPDEDSYRMWSIASNRFGWSSYLCGVDMSAIPAAAVPGRCEDLSGLAPAWIGVGTLDLFYEEDLSYAEHLEEAGVPCQLHVTDGAYHAFDVLHAKTEVGKAFTRSWREALRRALVEDTRERHA